jgi:hypothetical protein
LLVEGTLDECIRAFMAKPESARHLYEIHTAPQPPVVTEILSAEHVIELARLRDFLWLSKKSSLGNLRARLVDGGERGIERQLKTIVTANMPTR